MYGEDHMSNNWDNILILVVVYMCDLVNQSGREIHSIDCTMIWAHVQLYKVSTTRSRPQPCYGSNNIKTSSNIECTVG